MFPLALLFVSWCVVVLTTPQYYDLSKAQTYFKEFVTKFGKKYSTQNEMSYRFEIFQENLKEVNKLNQEENANVFGINQFMDLDMQDFIQRHTGFRYMNYDDYCKVQTDDHIPDTDVPDSFDWRLKNAVTEVGDQGNCRGSFAFSAAGVLEGQFAIHQRGRLERFDHLELSKQQIIDCDHLSDGCCGGFPGTAIKSVITQGGIMRERDYPFEGQQDICAVNNSFIVPVKRCFSWSITSQEKIKQLLYSYGPISIAVRAEGLMKYNQGIVHKCVNIYGVNHAVLLVGYGTENGIPYWTVKNSWSAEWGESGFFRLLRGEGVSSEILHHYTKGIIMDDQCTAKIQHGVLLVGYGTENGIPYWIVKNSWGPDVEENGYYRMQRSKNPNGACRMLNTFMATATVD